MIGEFKRGITLFGGGWGLYQEVLAGKISGQAIGEEEIAGKKTLGVAISWPVRRGETVFRSGHAFAGGGAVSIRSDRGPSDNEQHWSDYRTVRRPPVRICHGYVSRRNEIIRVHSAIGAGES